jgi:hypothetical protein
VTGALGSQPLFHLLVTGALGSQPLFHLLVFGGIADYLLAGCQAIASLVFYLQLRWAGCPFGVTLLGFGVSLLWYLAK